MWCFDLQTNQWSEIKHQGEYKPTPRSGHTSVVHGNKMYIFGGLLELTKELNDLVIFDLETQNFYSDSDNGVAIESPELGKTMETKMSENPDSTQKNSSIQK